MLLFISTDILLLAVGAVLYLMVRALPRITEEPSDQQGVFDRLAHSQIPEKLDSALDAFLLKFLRKVKIFTMRLDNLLSKHLRKISTDDDAKVAINFNDFVSGATADERELQEIR